jgi:hypothetical protein
VTIVVAFHDRSFGEMYLDQPTIPIIVDSIDVTANGDEMDVVIQIHRPAAEPYQTVKPEYARSTYWQQNVHLPEYEEGSDLCRWCGWKGDAQSHPKPNDADPNWWLQRHHGFAQVGEVNECSRCGLAKQASIHRR